MMPTIRISDQTWERLKRHAEPLVDTPDDVIASALDALEGIERHQPVRGPTRLAPQNGDGSLGEKLPQKEFRAPLLATLLELGGRAQTPDIRTKILPKIAHRLSRADHESVSSGDPRWWNAVCWERNDLVKEGLLRSDSARGIWELTEEGIKLARLKCANRGD